MTKKSLGKVGAIAAAATVLASGFAAPAMAQTDAAPQPSASAVDPGAAECGNQNIAYILDFSASFTDDEMNAQKDQAKKAIERLSKIPGTKISMFNFATMSPLAEWSKVGDYDGQKSIPQNAPAINFDISTQEGKEKALNWVDNTVRHPNGWNYASESTNWDAGLKAVLDSGTKYDTVVFSSDGAPNSYIDDATGKVVRSATSQFDQHSWDEAKKTFDKLTAKGSNVVPVFIYDKTDDGYEPHPEMMGKLVKNNAKSGVDYYEGDITKLANNIYKAATALCPTDLKVDKSVVTDLSKGVQSGQEIQYKLTAFNDGNWDEQEAIVEDLPLNGLDKDSVKITPKKGKVEGTKWTIGTLKAGERAEATVTVKVDGQQTSDKGISNAVSITGKRDPYDPNGPKKPNDTVEQDDDNYDVTTTEVKGDVKIHKVTTTEVKDIAPGGEVKYTITAKNAGAMAEGNVQVTEKPTDAIDADSIKIESETGTSEGNVWNIGTLQPGQEVTATVTAKLSDKANIKDGIANAATITSDGDKYDPNGPNKPNDSVDEDDDNFDSTTVTSDTDVKILKVADGEQKPGEDATWTVTVKNEGKDDASKVWSADLPTEGIDEGTVKFSDASYGEIVNGQKLIDEGWATADEVKADGSYWMIGDLKADQEITAKVTGKVAKDAKTTDNAAIVNSPWDKYDPNGPKQDNETVSEDSDNWDGNKNDVVTPEKPAPASPAPETPAPTTPAPAQPSAPQGVAKDVPAQPGNPAPQHVGTGEEASEDDTQSDNEGDNQVGMWASIAGVIGLALGFLLGRFLPNKKNRAVTKNTRDGGSTDANDVHTVNDVDNGNTNRTIE